MLPTRRSARSRCRTSSRRRKRRSVRGAALPSARPSHRGFTSAPCASSWSRCCATACPQSSSAHSSSRSSGTRPASARASPSASDCMAPAFTSRTMPQAPPPTQTSTPTSPSPSTWRARHPSTLTPRATRQRTDACQKRATRTPSMALLQRHTFAAQGACVYDAACNRTPGAHRRAGDLIHTFVTRAGAEMAPRWLSSMEGMCAVLRCGLLWQPLRLRSAGRAAGGRCAGRRWRGSARNVHGRQWRSRTVALYS